MRIDGDILRQQRLRRALTQKELAEAAGVSYVTISRIENGQSGPVKPPTLRKISTALDVTPETLILWGSVDEGAEAKKCVA